MDGTKKSAVEALEDGIYVGKDKLLSFVPQVGSVREIQSGEGIRRWYDITISKRGAIVDQITIDDLYVKSWFRLSRHCPDAGLSNRARKLLEHHLQEQAAKLPVLQEIRSDKKGWCLIDRKNVYCRKDIIVCETINGAYFGNIGCRVITVEDFEFVPGNSRAILENIKKTADGTSWILYLVSYFDILKGLFRRAGHPIEFLTNIYGESRSGKTSLVKTICSPSQVFSFRSAKRRDTILREAKGFGGETVLFDDYHPAENKADRDRQGGMKDSLVRMVEEVEDAPNIIISSEYLEGHLSLQDREIQIFLDKNMDWGSLDGLANEQDQLENIRVVFYVQIVKHADDVVADIKKLCDTADKAHCADRISTYRNIRYASYIQCVNHLFHKYFIGAYGIKWHCNIDDDLHKHMRQQERHMYIVSKLEHDRSYIPILREMFLDENGNGLERVRDRSVFRCDSRTYYVDPDRMLIISPKALRRGLMVYLRSGDIPFKRIIKEMVDAGVVETYKRGAEYTKKCQYGRYYEINTKELEEYCSLFE